MTNPRLNRFRVIFRKFFYFRRFWVNRYIISLKYQLGNTLLQETNYMFVNIGVILLVEFLGTDIQIHVIVKPIHFSVRSEF